MSKIRKQLSNNLLYYLSHTLRSWLHEISALITTLSPGLEKNYTLERNFNSFPGTASMPGCLENYYKYIHMSRCSPIQGTIWQTWWSWKTVGTLLQCVVFLQSRGQSHDEWWNVWYFMLLNTFYKGSFFGLLILNC